MLTNASLAILIENINGRRAAGTTDSQVASELRARQNQYFTFILWSTFGLSLTRFLGVRNRDRLSGAVADALHLVLLVSLLLCQTQRLPLVPTCVKKHCSSSKSMIGGYSILGFGDSVVVIYENSF